MTPHIFYIHGFGSGPNQSKRTDFARVVGNKFQYTFDLISCVISCEIRCDD